MNTSDDDLFRVDGSKVWMSQTAREMARSYGMTNVEFAQYLRMRHRIQTAALSPSNISTDALAPYLAAPSALPQEYEAQAGEPQTENLPLNPEDTPYLPTVAPLD